MYRELTIVLAVLLPCAACFGQGPVDDALEELRRFDAGSGRARLLECARTIRENMSSGDLPAWRSLREIILDPDRPPDVAPILLDIAFEKADQRIAEDVVSLGAELLKGLPDPPGLGPPETQHRIRLNALLADRLLDALLEERWKASVGADRKTLELLQNYYLSPYLGPGGWSGRILTALHASPAPAEQKRVLAEEIVAAKRRSTEHSPALVNLLSEESFPGLRRLVRESPVDEFHYGAAAALGDLGDREILPYLKELRAGGAPRPLDGDLQRWIWRIEIQHPPQRLLDYIESTDDQPMLMQRRMWVVQRAVDVGLPKEQIRRAILDYAAKIEGDERHYLASLKRLGLKLEVLHADDLPDVWIPHPGTP
jgi:hypothetical protein